MDRLENVPLEGELNCWARGFDMPDVLLKVCETGKTGLLRFASAEAEKTLFVRDGQIIFAKSTSLDDRLGEYLLRRGQISIPDLMRLATEVRPGRRLGTVLVENNILEAKDLVSAVVGQVRAIILSLFRWTEAWYGFNEQDLPNETITLNMPRARLIIDGIQLIDSWRRIAQGVGELSSVYTKVSGNERAIRSLNLDAATLEVLAILTQPLSVEQVCTSSRLPDLDVCRHLWIFRCLGWIEQTDGAEAGPSTATEDSAVSEEKGEEQSIQEEPVGGRKDSDETAAEGPSVAGSDPSVSESEPSVDESEFRFDVDEDSPVGVSLNDLPESNIDADEAGTGEHEEFSPVDAETEYPNPLPQSAEESNAEGTAVIEGGETETRPTAAEEIPVIEATPLGVSSAEGDEVPVIEGAAASAETKPVEKDQAPVVDGVVMETTDEETKTGDGPEEAKKAPIVASEDMDFEGLGMVLGEEIEE